MPDSNNEAKRRPLRSRDEIWLPASERAKREGTNISRVINDFLLDYGRPYQEYELKRSSDAGERQIYGVYVTPQSGSRYLLITVPEIDAVTQARKVSKIEEMARDLIAVTLDIEPDSFKIEFPEPSDSGE